MRQNRYLEYKENANSNTFMKTISAYANYGTGKIIFGITDDEEVVGIENPEDACLNLENKINDSMKPVPQYLLEIGNDSTITPTVYEGPYKPYLYKGKERKLVDKIPEKAFREAIANALVHRAWDVNASIKVSMYENRIEISSPGGLPSELSEEEYLNGQISILRNPIIGNVFFRLKYIEKFGTGILRINYAYEESIKKPTYKVFDNSIMINLPVFETKGKLTKTEQRLVQLLEENDEMSRKQIETEMQLGKATAIRLLNDLAKRNIICKKGAGRAVKYTTIGK